jgi:hypothetical protein
MCLPKGYISLKGIGPDGNSEVDFDLSQKSIDHFQRYGPTWKFNGLFVLPDILKNPYVIFQGLMRDNLENAYCYSGIPAKWYRKVYPEEEVDFPSDEVLVAYVELHPNQRFIIFDWDKRKQDTRKLGYPKNWESDFGDPIWPRD